MRRALASLALTAVLVTGACSTADPVVSPRATAPPTSRAPSADEVLVSFGSASVAVEVVATSAGRQRGLMHREHLDADAGMLFLFPGLSRGGFWMKDTLIPLSIAYLRWRGPTVEVVDILDMEPCRTTECPSYPPSAAYNAALEVNQGWFEAAGVSAGGQGEIIGDLPTAV